MGAEEPALAPSAAFTDLDGTFLSLEKTIPEVNLEAAAELVRRRIPLVVATGRPVSGIYDFILEIPGVRYLIYANGAGIWDVRAEGEGLRCPDGRVIPGARIHSAPLDPAAFTALYRQVERLPITIDLFADGCAFTERERFHHLEEFDIEPNLRAQIERSRTFVDVPLPKLVGEVACPERLSVYYGREEDRLAVRAALEADRRFVVTSSELTNLEASSPAATKGRALLWLSARLGVDPARTVAFGDGMNDTLMFADAGWGVAPANAQPGVAELADEQTAETSGEGAVGRWLLRHLA